MLHHLPITKYSGLTIILDHPSRLDTKYLISGYPGQYFDIALKPLSRLSCEIRTSDNKTGFLPDTKTVLLLGQDSLSLVEQDHDLMYYRGSPIVKNGLVHVATFTPQDSYDRKNYENDEDETDTERESEKDYQRTKRSNWSWWMFNDIKKAVRYTLEGYKLPKEYKINVYPSIDVIKRFTTRTQNTKVFIDIENNPHKQLTCIGFGTYDSDEIYVIPWTKFNKCFAYSLPETYEILRCIARLFSQNTIIGHNIGHYDLLVLCHFYGVPLPKNIEDTLAIQQRCYPRQEKSLGHCISLYTDYPNHKGEGIYVTHNNDQDWQLWMYNGRDVARTIEVYKAQQLRMLELCTLDSATQVNKSLYAYNLTTLMGAKLNIPYLEKLHQQYLVHAQQVERILKLLTHREINPKSWQQVGHYLYNELKLGNYETDSTDKKVLYKLYAKHPFPSIRCLLECKEYYRKASDLQFKAWGKNKDRITCSWNTSGTVEFRLASRALWRFRNEKGYGRNMQNWNKELRRCVQADDGKKLGQRDQGGADALIVAYLCRHGKYRDLFLNGIKPHIYVALKLEPFRKFWEEKMGEKIDRFLNASIPELPKQDRWKDLVKIIKATEDDPDPGHHYYFLAKKTGHASNYDMKWPTFQQAVLTETEGQILLTNSEARYFLDFYKHELFPEIPEWWIETQQFLRYKSRRIKNLFGYSCEFNGPLDDSLYRKVYAWLAASVVATITNKAYTSIQERIENKDPIYEHLDLLQNGHDSILFQDIDENILVSAKDTEKYFHVELISPRGEKFYMKSSVGIGKNWGPKTDKNPEGIEEI